MLRRFAPSIAALLLIAPIAASAAEKKGEEYTSPKAAKEVLHKQDNLASGDDLEANVIRFTIPPGFKGGRHYHTGDVFVYVQSGELTVETAKGTQTFGAGELYYETPSEPMLARNVSTSEDTVLVVFQVGRKGEPLMIKAEE